MNLNRKVSQCTTMQQQQTIDSDLNPNATEFVSKEELWFQTMEKEFVWKNSWLFEETDDEQNDTQYEIEQCSTPPQILEDSELEECDLEEFRGESCESRGYLSGNLSCLDCQIIETGCN